MVKTGTVFTNILRFRGTVSRAQFWALGGWLLFIWVVWLFTAAILGVAGGWFPAVLIYSWLAFTPFALFAWTALVVGRLRHLRTSLWWMMLWPLTVPVFWLVIGVLPAGKAETEGGQLAQGFGLRCSHPAGGLCRGSGHGRTHPIHRVEALAAQIWLR